MDTRKFSGRDTDDALTTFLNQRIWDELGIKLTDTLVDIGCGDGTLLRIGRGINSSIGFSASEKETAILRELGLNVSHAYSHSLPLPDQCASVVVMNGVLHIVPRENIEASLREIVRISKSGARVWIGELPRFKSASSIREFSNYRAMLWWLLTQRGLRTFLGMCRRIVLRQQKEPILRTGLTFWADPESFSQMAATAGLTLERHFPAQTFNKSREVCDSNSREDYVLQRM